MTRSEALLRVVSCDFVDHSFPLSYPANIKEILFCTFVKEMLSILHAKRKTDRFSKNKTRKTLTRKILLGITLPVAKVTAFETSEGTANRVVTLWERAKTERFVVAMTPVAEAERLARKEPKGSFGAPG